VHKKWRRSRKEFPHGREEPRMKGGDERDEILMSDGQASLISGSPEITENKLISGPFQSYFWDMGKYGKYGK